MRKQLRVGIIGEGNIGSALREKLEVLGLDLAFYANSKKVWLITRYSEDSTGAKDEKVGWLLENDLKGVADLIFLTIPTKDDGRIARDYILHAVKCGVPVVTCEKGAMANYFDDLRPHLDMIGYSACVGGGTLMLHHLRRRLQSGSVRKIHAICNGTLNYLLDETAHGRPFGQVLQESIKLGYAEPSENGGSLAIMRGEAEGDIPKKIAVMLNTCFGLKQTVKVSDLTIHELKKEFAEQVVEEASDWRFVVTIQKTGEGIYAARTDWTVFAVIDGWQVEAGFRPINSNPIIRHLALNAVGVDNGLAVIHGPIGEDGKFHLIGPGAGAGPTTEAMIIDAMELLGSKS